MLNAVAREDQLVTVQDEAAVVESGDLTTTVPDDASEGITIESDGGDVISIGLPNAESAAPAQHEVAGIVAYDNGDGSTTVPVVKSDGSVQITTVIESPDAPTEYVYPLDVPAGATVELDESGFVSIVSASGEFLGGFASAWAKDARGAEVATHYEVDGTTLTQVVEHGERASYPVVADPWLGIDLIQKTAWTSNLKTLQVYPTAYGRAATNLARWAGWAEVQTKTPNTRENTTSMQDQFLCHFDVVRLRAPNKVSWNLELGRPNVPWAEMLLRECNP